MEEISFSGNILQVGRLAVRFDHPIAEVARAEDRVIVRLEHVIGTKMTENVFGVNEDGSIAWQIEPCIENSTNPINYYTGIGPQRGQGRVVSLSNWSGTAVTIDSRTGKILHKCFTK